MKKLLLATVVVLFAISANAQVKFGLKAGINLPNFSIKEDGGSAPDTKMSFGFHLGGIADISLSESFSFQPGIMFTTKGFKADMSEQGISVSTTTKLNYIEIPVNAMFKAGSGSAKFLIFGGPYLAYGLGGTMKGEAMGISASTDITFGSGENDLKPLDLGINIGAGVEINSFLITAQYGLGLANLSNSSGETIKNNVIGISVGFLFGGK